MLYTTLFQFGAPVLLFPEGYCANNTQVLQFRKAIFQDGVKIYPMAVKLVTLFFLAANVLVRFPVCVR